MILGPNITQRLADAALAVLRRHAPDGEDIGAPILAQIDHDREGNRVVAISTRLGHYMVTSTRVIRCRRLDSPLGEPWNTTDGGLLEMTTWVDGQEIDRFAAYMPVARMDQALAAHDEARRRR